LRPRRPSQQDDKRKQHQQLLAAWQKRHGVRLLLSPPHPAPVNFYSSRRHPLDTGFKLNLGERSSGTAGHRALRALLRHIRSALKVFRWKILRKSDGGRGYPFPDQKSPNFHCSFSRMLFESAAQISTPEGIHR
jgi:hypothetical protein